MNSEQVGKVNQGVKALLLQVKSLASSLPDVDERDTGAIVGSCQEVSRLLLALTAQLRDVGESSFADTVLAELRLTVQSFLSLVKRFVADESFDDDATNAAVLAVTAAIKPVIDTVNRRKATLLAADAPPPPSVLDESSTPSLASPSLVAAVTVAGSPSPVTTVAPAVAPATPTVVSPSSPPVSPRTSDAAAADDDDKSKNSSLLRKMSRSISNASEKMRAKLKRAPTESTASPPPPVAAAAATASGNDELADSDSKRERAAKGGGFMDTLRSRFRLPQGWFKIKLSKEKKQDAKEKLESDLEQVDAAESEEIVQRLKKLDDETVTAGDVGDIAIAVKAARVNLETRVSSSSGGPDNTRARESIMRLKSMEKTLAETLRESISLAAPPVLQPEPKKPEPAAPATPVAAAPPARPDIADLQDTAQLEELLGIDEKATLSELDALLETAKDAEPAQQQQPSAEDTEWSAIENLLSEYA
jgi:hypothetical protein